MPMGTWWEFNYGQESLNLQCSCHDKGFGIFFFLNMTSMLSIKAIFSPFKRSKPPFYNTKGYQIAFTLSEILINTFEKNNNISLKCFNCLALSNVRFSSLRGQRWWSHVPYSKHGHYGERQVLTLKPEQKAVAELLELLHSAGQWVEVDSLSLLWKVYFHHSRVLCI